MNNIKLLLGIRLQLKYWKTISCQEVDHCGFSSQLKLFSHGWCLWKTYMLGEVNFSVLLNC